MYAQLPVGPTAVPGFVASNKAADPSDYESFTGFEKPLGPPPAPCSMGYRMEELKLAVERRRGWSKAGPAPVAIGWWVIGNGEPYFVVGSSGFAWPTGR